MYVFHNGTKSSFVVAFHSVWVAKSTATRTLLAGSFRNALKLLRFQNFSNAFTG